MRTFVRISRTLNYTCRLLTVLTAIVAAGSVGHTQALPLSSEQPVSFTNVTVSKGDDPHASGVGIELFKHGAVWTGFISEFVGPVADPPVGQLDDLQLDERTGTIVFTARLSLDAISGNLVRRVVDDAAGRSTSEKIVLKREAGKSSADKTSYDDWIRNWQLRIKARGPK